MYPMRSYLCDQFTIALAAEAAFRLSPKCDPFGDQGPPRRAFWPRYVSERRALENFTAGVLITAGRKSQDRETRLRKQKYLLEHKARLLLESADPREREQGFKLRSKAKSIDAQLNQPRLWR